MKKTILVIAGFVALASAYFLVGKHLPTCGCSIFKALPNLLLIAALCQFAGKSENRAVIALAVSALVFSVIGDTFGEFKRCSWGDTAFLIQIASFGVAQILYSIQFLKFVGRVGVLRLALASVVVAYFIGIALKIVPLIDTAVLKTAASAYMCLITFMSLTAVLQRRKGYVCFAVGALLFLASDSMIAYGLFVDTFPYRGLLVMLTYYAAQLLLNITLIKDNDYDREKVRSGS